MQQYVLDQFREVQAEKHSYIREHQRKLRAYDCSRMRDLLGDWDRIEYEASVVRVGRLLTLPLAHVGGEPYVCQQIHYIITISNSKAIQTSM